MTLEFDTTTQEYVEIIYELQKNEKVARVKDIAHKRGVTKSSVSTALSYLKDKKLVKHENYGLVELTETGVKLGRMLERRHKIIEIFLEKILDINEMTAKENACVLEHHMSSEILDSLVDFISYIQSHPEWLEHYKAFKAGI
ncbi:metal-dependent transcriptional regulator [candidate division KSB1 bacterium]|nr:metal-dependent transcriptional regulator [candidate division KSB1 bacterium]